MIEIDKMEMDPEGLYDPPLIWSKRDRRVLKALETPVDTQPELLEEAIAGSTAAIRILREEFRMTSYIHRGVRII